MADADPIDAERLGNDDVVDAVAGDAAASRRERRPRPSRRSPRRWCRSPRRFPRARLPRASSTPRHRPRRRSRLSCPRCRGRRFGRRGRSPPNGSTVHPSPAGTTSRWPFRCNEGPRASCRGGARRRSRADAHPCAPDSPRRRDTRSRSRSPRAFVRAACAASR